jgi:hypothetical protein
MSKTIHTQGPWHIERPFQEPGVYVSAASTALIAKLYPVDANTYSGDALTTIEANAQLIAAAPDLLAALRDIIGSCRKAGVAIVDLSRGDAAIRKAETGE